ncbi:MAG TPA: YaiO family outer membrane beta-barrel protein [Chitinophagaceae bacterium]|nr:YaiO family outer membrane beta-barrel protein [Chitinophagaceae bacterium]
MFTSSNIRYLLVGLLTLSVLWCTNVYAQGDTTTSDGLLKAAQYAAFKEHDNNKAKLYCIKALGRTPDYADVRIFLGRLYAWDKQYDSARVCFETVLAKQPGYEDASIAFADAAYWNNDYALGLKIIDSALKYHPASVDLLIRKAKMLVAMRMYQSADTAVNMVLFKNRSNSDALALANMIKDNVTVNRIGISYNYVHFDKSFPSSDAWHLVAFEYTRQTKAGPITGRINYANRFKTNGVQYELEAYPYITKNIYAYVNAGYSNNVGVFPQWRGGFSLYANLPKAFEGELGWRYLYFSSSTNIVTAYLGKYYKSWLFGARTYLIPGGAGISQSYNALARYYFGGANDYLGLTLGTGISPDARAIDQLIATANLKTYTAVIDFKHTIGPLNIIILNASIINQQINAGAKGNQVQLGIGYQRRF